MLVNVTAMWVDQKQFLGEGVLLFTYSGDIFHPCVAIQEHLVQFWELIYSQYWPCMMSQIRSVCIDYIIYCWKTAQSAEENPEMQLKAKSAAKWTWVKMFFIPQKLQFSICESVLDMGHKKGVIAILKYGNWLLLNLLQSQCETLCLHLQIDLLLPNIRPWSAALCSDKLCWSTVSLLNNP